jgi:deoxyribodipyrimidine photo-lyase
MTQILWFRRDLRIDDNAILSFASGKVLPIFIFDTNILDNLPKDDKRVTFIYKSVLTLKEKLRQIGLDLKVFYGDTYEIFEKLSDEYDEVLFSCDFDSYAKSRDLLVQSLMPVQRFYDSFLIHPSNALKSDGTPYKVFTPFYKSLEVLWQSLHIQEYKRNEDLTLCEYDYSTIPTLESMGFEEVDLPDFLQMSANEVLENFIPKLGEYQKARDFFALNGTSNIATHLRFGLISPKQIFNIVRDIPQSEFYIRELFWREFYNYILYHFPKSQKENFNGKSIEWNENKEHFKAWCEGNTGVPIIDAAMRHLNTTGTMHNRLRMVVASFLTKNLFLPWQWGEEYFALKLLDYEASSNIGSWQWGASTGADCVPYFRVFNPYTQSAKFDKDGIFIKSFITELKDIDPKLFHKENGVQENLFIDYPKTIVDIKISRQEAIDKFKYSSNS